MQFIQFPSLPFPSPHITDIEELIGCTSPNGPGLLFAEFVRLLVGALKHQTQEHGAEGVRLEWPTPQELVRRVHAAKGKAVTGKAAGTSTSSKRYLLLTHTTAAGRVSK